ncbi:sn-glycerol-3-phosphate ABC transporter ATP-binding protein UgpC [Streptococcus danieliae]|uniref:sn-glycerol-3-phosphate ABC transporter ATP-binding protein UgpC n=1 Tax=Streptococcus danieliae TaxID=747656 RepID=A0A7X3G908_9STRE|nr:sn-glycerol-3-phosphate ABC transporter ATP-binding protein UgpC [Streptococcus danieliae]MBF0699398.1 sn-glycerol-3-phosphate ABC transporter ATP-binding protein UgpC [Streptococcus danieliae]MBF0716805.1 sn-glycerol-3-phosphate ABC transporter ATP-binding protein UgpC [Streptococcus danieliae]MCU0081951.1 sn-glycerol-3-phosphate ABC transporter ATP-binding protein UgpC [Streptococcus danieliae]MVX59338.1 sn-glycerol-3-phosphate ABC transporter ATP-binding protein UgpC [Streptococcus daniel
MATLSLKNIYKRYDNGYEAVKDFNLEVADKEFIALVGPSGCGKSTTLRMIAGLEDITQGEFYIDQDLVNDVEPKDRDIAMVFQSYALYPHMTVFENMAFALNLRKESKEEIKKKVEEAAEILGLSHLLDRLPKALSGGQRQRVALGRAIVRAPKVFLMDEPLSNLDAKLRGDMRAEIIRITQRLGATTIYVTHDQTEAMTMADRIVVMNIGVVQQIGTPKEIYENPRNLFVAGFVGAPTMNFIHGRIQGDHFISEDGTDFKLGQGQYAQLKAKGYDGKEVILGIRPENISNDPLVLETYPQSQFEADVDFAELLGAEYIVHTHLGKTNLKAIVHSRQDVHMGQKMSLALDMNRAHFFDKETEENILH